MVKVRISENMHGYPRPITLSKKTACSQFLGCEFSSQDARSLVGPNLVLTASWEKLNQIPTSNLRNLNQKCILSKITQKKYLFQCPICFLFSLLIFFQKKIINHLTSDSFLAFFLSNLLGVPTARSSISCRQSSCKSTCAFLGHRKTTR